MFNPGDKIIDTRKPAIFGTVVANRPLKHSGDVPWYFVVWSNGDESEGFSSYWKRKEVESKSEWADLWEACNE